MLRKWNQIQTLTFDSSETFYRRSSKNKGIKIDRQHDFLSDLGKLLILIGAFSHYY